MLVACLALMMAAPAVAQDKAKPKKAAGPDLFAVPKTITLSTEQNTKLGDIRAKYQAKAQDLQKQAALSADQKAARKKAQDEAKAAGKKGKELQAAVQAAVQLTDEQRKATDELAALQKEIKTAISGILTDEQKSLLPGAKKKKAA
jgi:hypothetical protein